MYVRIVKLFAFPAILYMWLFAVEFYTLCVYYQFFSINDNINRIIQKKNSWKNLDLGYYNCVSAIDLFHSTNM